ncbi:MAG: hypothetical protein ICV87_02430 [Gemmatimonadetes bacterium]|nr:hypothetical protein [Gemmatimonadota bacterium]
MRPFPFSPRHTEGVGRAFRDEIDRAIAGLSRGVREILDWGGYALVTGLTVVDAEPGLAGQRPRGYPPDATWENSPGGYLGGTAKRIVVAETYRDYESDRFVPCTHVAGALRHEVGHALDDALGGVSAGVEFLSVYVRDRLRLRERNLQDELAYFLNEDLKAGADETFAELVAIACGGGAAGVDELMASTFEDSLALVKRILEDL